MYLNLRWLGPSFSHHSGVSLAPGSQTWVCSKASGVFIITASFQLHTRDALSCWGVAPGTGTFRKHLVGSDIEASYSPLKEWPLWTLLGLLASRPALPTAVAMQPELALLRTAFLGPWILPQLIPGISINMYFLCVAVCVSTWALESNRLSLSLQFIIARPCVNYETPPVLIKFFLNFYFFTYQIRIMGIVKAIASLSWCEDNGHNVYVLCSAWYTCCAVNISVSDVSWTGPFFQIKMFGKMPPEGMSCRAVDRDVLRGCLALLPEGWWLWACPSPSLEESVKCYLWNEG